MASVATPDAFVYSRGADLSNRNSRASFDPMQRLPRSPSPHTYGASVGSTSSSDESGSYHIGNNLSYDPPLPKRVKPPEPAWRRFLRRFPYFSCLAALLCCVGGGLFAGYLHATVDMSMVMLQEVMHISYWWMEGAEIVMIIVSALLVTLSLIVFGATFIVGAKDYDDEMNSLAEMTRRYGTDTQDGRKRKKKTRRPLSTSLSRTPTLVFTCLLAPNLPIWFFFLMVSISFWLFSWLLLGMCHTNDIEPLWNTSPPPESEQCKTILEGEDCIDCIDLYQFHFLFPSSARKEDMWICGKELYLLCDSDLPSILRYWEICYYACMLVIAGLFVQLMALSYTRTTLGAQRKLRVYRELKDRAYTARRVNAALGKDKTPLIKPSQRTSMVG